jgi:hypothetical protein
MALDIIGYINQEVTNLTPQQKQDMLDDLVSYFGYQETIDGEPNPIAKKEFANDKIKEFIRDRVKSVRKKRAEQQVTYEELEL